MILMGEAGYTAVAIIAGKHAGETFYIDASGASPAISSCVFTDCVFYIVDPVEAQDCTFTRCTLLYDKDASLIATMCRFYGGSLKYIDWEEFID